MPRLHAIELLPDAGGEASLRADWTALREAGLPSMLDHRGSTNTPHLTVLSATSIGSSLEAEAADRFGALLPVTARSSGLVVFGGERVSLARTLDLPDEVVRAVLGLRASARTAQAPDRLGWSPHLTLVRRLPRHDLQRAIDAVEASGRVVRLVALRRWDPDAAEVRAL